MLMLAQGTGYHHAHFTLSKLSPEKIQGDLSEITYDLESDSLHLSTRLPLPNTKHVLQSRLRDAIDSVCVGWSALPPSHPRVRCAPEIRGSLSNDL